MTDHAVTTCTAFSGDTLLQAGSLVNVALAVKHALEMGAQEPVLVFDDRTGQVIDLDLRGTETEIAVRLSQRYASTEDIDGRNDLPESRVRGRPKLGVVSREVTLLPRHWEWLSSQPGGASAVLRRLVDVARRTAEPRQQQRAAQEAAYRFMLAMAGDRPGYEEATRALFAGDRLRLEEWIASWPPDIRAHVLRLAYETAR